MLASFCWVAPGGSVVNALDIQLRLLDVPELESSWRLSLPLKIIETNS